MNGIGSLLSLVDLCVVRRELSSRYLSLLLKHEVLLVINVRIPSLRHRHLSEEGYLVRHDEQR